MHDWLLSLFTPPNYAFNCPIHFQLNKYSLLFPKPIVKCLPVMPPETSAPGLWLTLSDTHKQLIWREPRPGPQERACHLSCIKMKERVGWLIILGPQPSCCRNFWSPVQALKFQQANACTWYGLLSHCHVSHNGDTPNCRPAPEWHHTRGGPPPLVYQTPRRDGHGWTPTSSRRWDHH